uniref:Uncharacterized protein n=1 Tax=Bactrocera latifrons TaxID=174628 RepID=A0A0K8VZ45_BACLA
MSVARSPSTRSFFQALRAWLEARRHLQAQLSSQFSFDMLCSRQSAFLKSFLLLTGTLVLLLLYSSTTEAYSGLIAADPGVWKINIAKCQSSSSKKQVKEN